LDVTERSPLRAERAQDAPDMLDDLIRRFGDRVYKLAYYHVRDRYMAEDIAQEVFCRVYRNLDRFRGDSAYFTWIYRITVNLCRDYTASAGFRRMLPWRSLGDGARAAARRFEEAAGGEVFAAVMELPALYRPVRSLHYFEDLKTPEIARMLGISEANVRARLCRGREMLKKMLEETLAE
jgi:RNA polymerase sigma-70 factor (ECF subfamily)